MSEEKSGLFFTPIKGHEQALGLMKKLIDVAQPEAVFGEPLTVGEQTIITASEVSVGLGIGYGMGISAGQQPATEDGGEEAETEAKHSENETGGVGGGGGGGGSMARPVAVIHIGPEGVQVEPVVDITKIALTFLTVLGSIFMMGAKIRKMH